MPIIYSDPTKAARMNAVVTAIGASGKFKLLSATDQILATFPLAPTAGTVAAGVLTLSDANGGATAGIMNTTAAIAGTATKAIVTTAADVTIVSGFTVGTSGTDVVLDNPTFAFGQAITINSASLTHAA